MERRQHRRPWIGAAKRGAATGRPGGGLNPLLD